MGIIGLSKALFLSISSVSAAPLIHSKTGGHYHDEEPEAAGTDLWVLYVASLVLVLLGGAFAGLTIAYVLRSPFIVAGC